MDADKWTRKYDPKKHITTLLRQTKEILDKALDDAESAEDIEAYCLPLLFEVANIHFYLGLLGSNIRLHMVNIASEENKEEDKSSTAEVRTAPLADQALESKVVGRQHHFICTSCVGQQCEAVNLTGDKPDCPYGYPVYDWEES